ncbi:MAG TPA: molybdenum cofactor biosynthesis protein MoaE [Solirubrobacterales bacterium]|nr:molybdenum cofactor biosynthesis protein MoaE [Solirubrobacterales bacterium]
MVLQVRLFAILRERAGSDSLEIELAEGATVADAMRAIGAAREPLAGLLEAMPVVMAVNRSYVGEETQLSPGDELALIPPVSGGQAAKSSRPHVRVTTEPLSADRLAAVVATNHTGAIVSFQGTTRDVERLEYEAYEPMASERIEAILAEVATQHPLEGIAAEHRIGPVPLGELSVVVTVAAAHREEAFAAARKAIDRIKAEAPIWKREVEGPAKTWVEGNTPRAGD